MLCPQDQGEQVLAFTWNGRINIKNNRYKNDNELTLDINLFKSRV